MSYSIVKTLHVVVLAAWLGMEIAVFILFSRHRDFDGIPLEGRRALAEVHEPIAFGPRIFWMPMLVLGVLLTTLGDWAFRGSGGVVLVTGVTGLAVIWLAGQSYIYFARRSLPRLTSPLRHLAWIGRVEVVDTWYRVLLVAALGGAGAGVEGNPVLSPRRGDPGLETGRSEDRGRAPGRGRARSRPKARFRTIQEADLSSPGLTGVLLGTDAGHYLARHRQALRASPMFALRWNGFWKPLLFSLRK